MPAAGRELCGTPVGATVAPETLAEAEAVLAAAAGRGDAVAFEGGGTALELGRAPRRVDLLVRTERLARVVAYAPADLVIEAEAGMTLAALQRTAAASRQRLALDAPEPERATIGGLVATNAFGPLRARYGGLRDLIVGVSFVRADGTRARGGGRVVKNVAGFDLPKLAVGSLGTLGLVATATLRLHPLPASAACLWVTGCDAARLRALVRASAAAQLEPAAFVAERGEAGRYAAHVLFEGFAGGVADQRDRFAALARAAGCASVEDVDPGTVALVDARARSGAARVRAAAPPSALEALEARAVAPLWSALESPRAVVYPTLGIAFVSGGVRGPGDATAAAVAAARAALAAARGTLVVERPGAAPVAALDPWGPPPPAFTLMRGLKDRFDPQHRLNAGRFVGGL